MSKLKILVIEDSPDDALMIQKTLQSDADLDFAETGLEGIKKATTGGFDVVILDYKLTDLTGSEVMARIREKRPELPVIIASGMGSHFIVARTLALGAREFVNKDEPDFDKKLQAAVHHVSGTVVQPLSEAMPTTAGTGKASTSTRAQEIKRIINSVLENSDLVNTLGIVGADGALIQGHVQDKSGAQDVTAVLAGTCQMMLQTVARHLGYGSAKSFIASYERGAIAMTPLPGGLVLYFTSTAGPAQIDNLRAELEGAAAELAQVLQPKRGAAR